MRQNRRLPKWSDFCGADERDVAVERVLEDVAAAVDLAGLLAFFDDGADAGRREERGDARARGAHALGERALRRDLDFDLTRRHARVQVFVRADVAADDLRMMPALSQVARPLPRLPALFETSVRSRTPRSTTPRISASGFPERPKPPTMIVMPSRSGSSASAIDAHDLVAVSTDSLAGPECCHGCVAE